LEGGAVAVTVGSFLGRRAWGEGVDGGDGGRRRRVVVVVSGGLGPGFVVELLEAALSEKFASASNSGGKVAMLGGRAEGVEEECLEEDREAPNGRGVCLVRGEGVFGVVEGLGGGEEPAVSVVDELEDFSFAVGFEFAPDGGSERGRSRVRVG
jgi:hypothetical protein